MRTKKIQAVLIDTQNKGARYTVMVEAVWLDTQDVWMSPKTVDYQGYRYAYCGRFLDAERTPYYQTAAKI